MVTKTCLRLHVCDGRTAATHEGCGGLGVWRTVRVGGLSRPFGGHWCDDVWCLTIDDLTEEGGQCEEGEERDEEEAEEEKTQPLRE